MADEIKLVGMFASPFCRRIELVLKLKGLPFEYIEEDLTKKSRLLLQLNPVHNMVPVFIHNGKPIAESLVIMEYIEDTWGDSPILLPKDPYDRATVRFWAKFLDQEVFPLWFKVYRGKDDKQQHDAVKELSRQLKSVEGELKGKEYFGGESMGFLDIAAFFILQWIDVMQELKGIDLITRAKFPVIFKWLEKLRANDVVMGCVPPRAQHHDHVRARHGAPQRLVSLLLPSRNLVKNIVLTTTPPIMLDLSFD